MFCIIKIKIISKWLGYHINNVVYNKHDKINLTLVKLSHKNYVVYNYHNENKIKID